MKTEKLLNKEIAMPPVPAKTYAKIFAFVYQQTLVEEYKKALGLMRPHVESVLQKASSGSYPLRPIAFLNQNEISYCISSVLKKEQKVILVSHRDRSLRPEKNIDIPFWRAIEHAHGRDPWGRNRHEQFTKKTSWPEVAQSIDETMRKSFRSGLDQILADNIRETIFYFLSFFVFSNMEGINQMLPLIKKFSECIPVGRNQYSSDTWYVLTE